MKLISLNLKGFKAIDEIGLQDLVQVNYLVGPNGSGKSSVFEALAIPSVMTKNNGTGDLNLPLYGDLKRVIRSDYELKLTFSDNGETTTNTVKARARDHQTAQFEQGDFVRVIYQRAEIRSEGPSVQEWLSTTLDSGATNEELGSSVKQTYQFDLENAQDADAIKKFLNEHYVKKDEYVRNVIRSITDSRAIELEITSRIDQATSIRFEPLKTISSGYQQLLGLYFVIRQRIKDHAANAGQRVPIVCVEEPGLGLHPGIQKKLPSLFQLLLQEPGFENVVLLVTTHSPFIISAASDMENQKVYLLNSGITVDKAGRRRTPSTGYSAKKCLDVAASMLGAGFEDIGTAPLAKEELTVVYCEGAADEVKDSEIYDELFSDEENRFLFVSTGGFTEAVNSYLAARAAVKFVFGGQSKSQVLVDRSNSQADFNIGAIQLIKTSPSKPKFTDDERTHFLAADPLGGYRMLKRKEIENYLFDPVAVSLLPEAKRNVFSEVKLSRAGLSVDGLDYVNGEVKDYLNPSSKGLMVELASLIRVNKDQATRNIYRELLDCLSGHQ